MTWQTVTAAELRPGDDFRGCIREPDDPTWRVEAVAVTDDGRVRVMVAGQPVALVFGCLALVERRRRRLVSLDEWLLEQDALHDQRIAQGGYG